MERRRRLMANNVGSALSSLLTTGVTFAAPLDTSIVPQTGTGSATYTRATVATVFDNESVLRNVLSGEARFQGARRVRNLLGAAGNASASLATFTASGAIKTANTITFAGSGEYVRSNDSGLGTGVRGRTFLFTADVSSATGAVDFRLMINESGAATRVSSDITAPITPTRYSFSYTFGAAATECFVGWIGSISGNRGTITVDNFQWEDVTGQSNQAPSEYVSVGVLSTPFHGAGVDGVKYFSTTNGNSVASNVVTEASGAPISASTLLGYLAEGARTNSILQSAVFSDAAWLKGGVVTVTADSAVAPDGTTSADLMFPTTSGASREIYQSHGLAAGSITNSVYVKAAGINWIGLGNNGTAATAVFFNISAGTIGTQAAGYTGTITSVGNGWYRCAVTYTAGAPTYLDVFMADGDNTVTVTKSGTNGVYLWGAQAEAGSFASTYIPTTTASVVRNADVLTYPFAGNAIEATGALYAELSSLWTTGSDGLSSMAVGFGGGLQISPIQNTFTVPATQFQQSDGTTNNGKAGLSSTATGVRKRASSWGGIGQLCTGDGLTASGPAAYDGSYGSTAIGIGCNPVTSAQHWMGTIRNVRIYSAQLSAAQLSAVTA